MSEFIKAAKKTWGPLLVVVILPIYAYLGFGYQFLFWLAWAALLLTTIGAILLEIQIELDKKIHELQQEIDQLTDEL